MKKLTIDYKKLAEEIAENSQFQKCMTKALASAETSNKEERLYTIRQTCELLGISRKTFHLWRVDGKVEWTVLPSGSIRISSEQIQKLLKKSSNNKTKDGGNYGND